MRVAVLLVAAGVMIGMAGAQPPQAKNEPIKPKAGNALDYSGRIEATTVEIRPRLTGTLIKIAVKEGSAVKQGDLLAVIDPRQYEAELSLMKARLDLAQASRGLSAAEVQRIKSAAEKGVVARVEVDRAMAELERTQATIAIAKAELEMAQLNMDRTKLVAPMDGRVTRINQAPGALAVADGPPVLSIVATDPLLASFDIDERTFLKLRREGVTEPGKMTAEVALQDEEGFPHKLVVDFIDPEVNPSTGTIRVRGVLQNSKDLFMPGMSIRVRLTPTAK